MAAKKPFGQVMDEMDHEAKYAPDRMHPVWSALDSVIEAWEALPGGQNHSPRAVERWLATHMSPAINKARKAMGRKAPNED